MRIAIDAADLDHSRIDGTRIYIQNILKNFGPAARDRRDQFLIYHQSEFNPELAFPVFENYKIIKLRKSPYWTQTRFAWEMLRTKPDVLFMPMHSLPYLRSKKTKTVVTIHDLAFKFFPQFFPKKDLRRLNWFTDYAVKNADRIIAVSQSTKDDILKLYPRIDADKIRVIYHGYNKNIFNENISKDEIEKVKADYKIPFDKYLVYVGAIQPRKNIGTLIKAFDELRKNHAYKDLGLVIAGETGWLYDNIVGRIDKTENVMAIGKFETKELPGLLSGAEVFVLPSFYEGFGLPAIEAMACGVPVAAAKNSSLAELVGENGMLFDPYSSENLSKSLLEILENDKLKNALKEKGLERAKIFKWEKCAKETLEWLQAW